MADQSLLGTLTGEHFQPVRLHYRVLNHPGLKQAFEKLRCLEFDAPRMRWVWLYADEAKDLQFQRSYSHFPKELRPIVIGAFFLRTEETLLLDLRSCERALLAIPFFDQHLPRKLVALEQAEIVNRLFADTQENRLRSPDALFDGQISTGVVPAALVQRPTEKAAGIASSIGRYKMMLAEFTSRSKEPLPPIERLPVHYAEDGIAGFKLALQLRQNVAMEHLQGNPRYTLGDAIKAVIKMS